MNDRLLPFDAGPLALIVAYVASLLVIGWWGHRARRENTLKDFYLAGRGFGFAVLVLTLYATQYSGNTLIGFTGNTYRTGFSWVMSLHFMTAIIVCYLIFAPRLYQLAKRKSFITPTDYLDDRFHHAGINILATLVMIVSVSNFLLAQLMAMGRALEGLSPDHAQQVYLYGIITLALIMVVYETLGGLRAVAWTDAIQGTILFLGFAILLYLVLQKFGSLEAATAKILASPDEKAKALPPDGNRLREWVSYILILGMGAALYPQAIQRIYAARSTAVLRRSLAVMAFLPLTATLVALIVGVVALAHYRGLEGAEADRVLFVICRDVQAGSLLGYWLVAVLFAALMAAIMSTADSALLSISSMLTKDLYARFVRPDAREETLTRLGKACSWVLILILVVFAVALREHQTIVGLMDRKFDVLVQLVPAFMIGIHWRGLRAGPTFAGMATGIVLAVGLAAGGYGKLAGIHAGIYGLGVNLLVALAGSARFRNETLRPRSGEGKPPGAPRRSGPPLGHLT